MNLLSSFTIPQGGFEQSGLSGILRSQFPLKLHDNLHHDSKSSWPAASVTARLSIPISGSESQTESEAAGSQAATEFTRDRSSQCKLALRRQPQPQLGAWQL